MRHLMKEHTKAVLEACTGQLVALGLTRTRRSLAVWAMNDEMLGGVSLQVQVQGRQVIVVPVANVVWLPVEQLFARGRGQDFRPWTRFSITLRRPVMPPRTIGAFRFTDPEIDSRVLEKFGHFARHRLIGEVLELAEERRILRHYRTDAITGAAQAGRALAIKAWQSRTLDLDAEMHRLRAGLARDDARDRLERFHARLVSSPGAQALLGLGEPA